MRPILLQGHTRPLTQLKYNHDGDLLFSCSKDLILNVWYSQNGERLGTYSGHVGAVWSVDPSKDSLMLASGAADDTMRLWNTRTGENIHTWKLPTAVKRVAFSESGDYLLALTEQRMGHPGMMYIFPVNRSLTEPQSSDPIMTIETIDSKVTVCGWSYLDKYIIAGHENGSISQYDAETGERLLNVQDHEEDRSITDLQFSTDRTYFITSCKDKTARLYDIDHLKLLKTFQTDTPINSAAITPTKEFVLLGGGQEARDVTTTTARQGRFECRVYHKIFEEELGRIKGHFGPLNTIAVHPKGTGYASGGEDGLIRVHHFDRKYFEFATNF